MFESRSIVICCQFIFKPGTYDAEFHALDSAIDDYARGLPGFVRSESWRRDDDGLVNAIYYFDDEEAVRALASFPAHREAKSKNAQWYDGYEIVVSTVTSRYGDGRLGR